MEKQNKWVEELRGKLQNYSEPIPKGLWEQLEQELQEGVVQSPPKIIPMWKQWQAVAAVIIMLITSTLTFYFWGNNSEEFFKEQAKLIEQEILIDVKREEPITNEELTDLVKPNLSSNKKPTATLLVEVNEVTETKEQVVTLEAEDIEVKNAEQANIDTKNQPTQQVQDSNNKYNRKNFFTTSVTPTKKKNKEKVAFSLAMGNMPMGSSQSYGGYKYLKANEMSRFSLKLSANDGEADVIPNYEVGTIEHALSSVMLDNIADDEVTTNVNHHAPVTFGASLRFPLGDNWDIETGLTYTLLRSDLRSGSNSYYEKEYRLHYLGIPLKVSRSVWSNRNFEVYASAGGAVEKSVSGKEKIITSEQTETESLNIKELQWSLSATVGAQYKVAPKMGFYVEPGVAYYFSDGSGIETIRKEHPFNFNLQLGFRVDF